MKTNFFFFVLFISIFFSSCKDDKATNALDAVNDVKNEDSFKVTLELIAKKDGDFRLYYTEDGTINFKDNPVFKDVKGSEIVQQVVYNLPGGIYPTEFRLDFGFEKNQEEVILKSVTFEYKGKKRSLVGADMVGFFREDGSKCTFDAKTGSIKAIVKDGISQSLSLYPHEENLMKELTALAK